MFFTLTNWLFTRGICFGLSQICLIFIKFIERYNNNYTIKYACYQYYVIGFDVTNLVLWPGFVGFQDVPSQEVFNREKVVKLVVAKLHCSKSIF